MFNNIEVDKSCMRGCAAISRRVMNLGKALQIPTQRGTSHTECKTVSPSLWQYSNSLLVGANFCSNQK
jgi:hypothetical protein